MTGPRVLSVNVGRPAQIGVQGGQPLMSAIGKQPVQGRVRAEGVNLAGDDQADRTVHGGPDKAVYAYASEDAAWWEARLGRELAPGMFGENLTTQAIDLTAARLGDRWLVGSVLLEVCQPRLPCAKLGRRFGDPLMVRRFAEAGRPGAYLRILEEGELGAGDAIAVVHHAAGHDVTIGLASRAILHDRELLAELLAAPALPDSLRGWILGRAA
jgi:MOSC domain-containing protein YiiM